MKAAIRAGNGCGKAREVHPLHSGSKNRMIEAYGGFAAQQEAKTAGDRAKRFIQEIWYPRDQKLIVLTKRQ